MEYSFAITEYDANNIDSSFTINHGRTEHLMDLTQKIYTIYKKGDGIATQTILTVWADNVQTIQIFIQQEIDRINAEILMEKARLYEINNFTFFTVGLTEEAEINERLAYNQSVVTYLKNYRP